MRDLSNKTNIDENSSESLYNASFGAIGQAHISNLIDELSSEADSIEKIELSQSMNVWSKSFFGSVKVKRKASSHNFKKAAIYLIILFGVFTITTLSVEAFRIKFYHYFIEVKQEFARLYITRENTLKDPNLNIDHYYYPTLLPEGFLFDDHSVLQDIISMTYNRGLDQIVFIQSTTKGDYQLDTEDAIVTKVPIGDFNGYLIVKNDRTMLFWHNENLEFFLKGNIESDDLIRMAESIKKNKH